MAYNTEVVGIIERNSTIANDKAKKVYSSYTYRYHTRYQLDDEKESITDEEHLEQYLMR